jgi:hypothetical protein
MTNSEDRNDESRINNRMEEQRVEPGAEKGRGRAGY